MCPLKKAIHFEKCDSKLNFLHFKKKIVFFELTPNTTSFYLGEGRGAAVPVIFVAAVVVGVSSFPFAGVVWGGEGGGTKEKSSLCTEPPCCEAQPG